MHMSVPFDFQSFATPIPMARPLQPMTRFGQMMPPMGPMFQPPYVATGDRDIPPMEESYVENILRMNRGKVATVYTTYENNPEWPAVKFKGRIETAGRDHVILSDPDTGRRYLLLMVNVDYVTFDEPLQYVMPRVPGYVQL
jgi:spore germination protein Q